jgi:EAL domain-containing protein (putative c-di-GMP-specific phosphodiesterase class I)
VVTSCSRSSRRYATVIRTSLQSSCELLDGLKRRELVLHYQPIFGIGTSRIQRLEALSRWDHPDRGRLLPADFIDLTEHDGVGMAFTATVLRQAALDCVAWKADGLDAGVAINVSPRLLVDDAVPQLISEVLDQCDLVPSDLTLELTEGASGIELSAITATVAELATMGVRLSLDDFGCADSSLARLQTLPIAEIKIDRRFVTNVPNDTTDATIVRFVAALGRDLGLDVVAEGVEHPAALEYLQHLSVTAVQGFLLAKPAPIADLRR